jgi:hypothetical protein
VANRGGSTAKPTASPEPTTALLEIVAHRLPGGAAEIGKCPNVRGGLDAYSLASLTMKPLGAWTWASDGAHVRVFDVRPLAVFGQQIVQRLDGERLQRRVALDRQNPQLSAKKERKSEHAMWQGMLFVMAI